jgi:hypothetical protein
MPDENINIGFPNEPSFRYRNFFIPRVEKPPKMSPREEKLSSQGP